MNKIFEKSISVSDTTQVGIPFGASYKKPTPQFWRNVGDGLLAVSSIFVAIGTIIALPPTVVVIGTCAGIAGKYISNCFSKK